MKLPCTVPAVNFSGYVRCVGWGVKLYSLTHSGYTYVTILS